jgi:hypothetical protein
VIHRANDLSGFVRISAGLETPALARMIVAMPAPSRRA